MKGLLAVLKEIGMDLNEGIQHLLDEIADSRVVLLGEASHGTHEYYLLRSKISEYLIREKGFNFIAVEGDWPDCYLINRFVKHYRDSGETTRSVLENFNRWPTWMWANWEIAALMEWMYDCFLYLDKSKALHPLKIKPDKREIPETYPWEV